MSESHQAKLLAFPGIHDAKSSSFTKAFLSCDPQSQAIQRQLARLAPTEASVLIVGETGTGKERLAEALHAPWSALHVERDNTVADARPALELAAQLGRGRRHEDDGNLRRGWIV